MNISLLLHQRTLDQVHILLFMWTIYQSGELFALSFFLHEQTIHLAHFTAV